MTFEVKLLITFVAIHPLVILTKFGRNPIKHVEEEANCKKKERRKKKEERKKSQERNKLGDTPNLTRHLCLQADTGTQANLIDPCVLMTNLGHFLVYIRSMIPRYILECLDRPKDHSYQISAQLEHFVSNRKWRHNDPLMTLNDL